MDMRARPPEDVEINLKAAATHSIFGGAHNGSNPTVIDQNHKKYLDRSTHRRTHTSKNFSFNYHLVNKEQGLNVSHIASMGKHNVLLRAQAFNLLGKLHPPLVADIDIILETYLKKYVTCFDFDFELLAISGESYPSSELHQCIN